MSYDNNHYVPQFILRRFGNKINRYNIETGELKIKGSTQNAFSDNKIYPEWLEKMFGDIESRMANLIDKKILNAVDEVTITRAENILIKKFFTVATLRIPGTSLYTSRHLESEEKLKQQGFKEIYIEGETDLNYAYRTLKVVLESNSLEDLYNHPEVTYEACKWFELFCNCYLSIWDSKDSKEDFIITDDGMNCEHDRTRFVTFSFNGEKYKNERDEMLKNGYVFKKMLDSKDDKAKAETYFGLSCRMSKVHANYYIFAVSNTRTIALINPFYRLYDDPSYLNITGGVPDVWPTLLSRQAMECNSQTYIELGKSNDLDKFHYRIKSLSLEEVIIINNMMLDRVIRWIGFDDSSKISRSLNVYSLIGEQYQRRNYDQLVKHLYSLGYDFSKAKKYLDIRDKLITYCFTESEEKYIKFYYNLIKKSQCNIK